MVERTPSNLDLRFAALSEPTRRAVLERLTAGDATVTELAQPFAMSLQAFLKHVKVLEEAGLVRRTRIGRTSHVALVPDALQAVTAWLNARMPPVPPLAFPAGTPRRADRLEQARALAVGLAPRMALVARALEGPVPQRERFDPEDAVVRALQADVGRHPALREAQRLYAALGSALAQVEGGGDAEALAALIVPLGRLMIELRPLLPGEVAS